MPPGNPPSNQYDFIMSNNRQKAKKPVLPADGSQGQRLAVAAGIIVILLIFFVLLMNIVGRGGEDKASYITIIQRQTELARVAGVGAMEPSANQQLKNTASNVQATLLSNKQTLNVRLQTKGIKLKQKELAGVANKATDKRLADAKAAANFDSTLITTLNEQLTDYRSSLEQAFDHTKSKTLKDALGQMYRTTDLLQKQLSATEP